MTDGVFPVSTGHVGMEQQAFSSLPNSHNRIFGDADGIVLIFGCHFVVDKVFSPGERSCGARQFQCLGRF